MRKMERMQQNLDASEKHAYKEYCQNLREVFTTWATDVGADAPPPLVEALIKFSWEQCLADKRKFLESTKRQQKLEKRLVNSQRAYFQEVVMLRDRIRGIGEDHADVPYEDTTFYEPLKYLDENTRELCKQIVVEELKKKEEHVEEGLKLSEYKEPTPRVPEEDHPPPSAREGCVPKAAPPALSALSTMEFQEQILELRTVIEELEAEKDEHGKERRRWQMAEQRRMDELDRRQEQWEREVFQTKQNLSSVMMENKALTLANRRLRDQKNTADAIHALIASHSRPMSKQEPMPVAPAPVPDAPDFFPSERKVQKKVKKKFQITKCAVKPEVEVVSSALAVPSKSRAPRLDKPENVPEPGSVASAHVEEHILYLEPNAPPLVMVPPSKEEIEEAASKIAEEKVTAACAAAAEASAREARDACAVAHATAMAAMAEEHRSALASQLEQVRALTNTTALTKAAAQEDLVVAQGVAALAAGKAAEEHRRAIEKAEQEVRQACIAEQEQLSILMEAKHATALAEAVQAAREEANKLAQDDIAHAVAEAAQVSMAAAAAENETANDHVAEKEALVALLQNAERQIQEFKQDMHRQRRMSSTIESSNGFRMSYGDTLWKPASTQGQVTTNSFFKHSHLGFRISDDLQDQLNRTEQRLRSTKNELGISELHREEAEGLLTALEREVHELEFSLKKHQLNLTDTNFANERKFRDDGWGNDVGGQSRMRHTVYSFREKAYDKRGEKMLRTNNYRSHVPANTPDARSDDAKSDPGQSRVELERDRESVNTASGTNVESLNLDSASAIVREETQDGSEGPHMSDYMSQPCQDNAIATAPKTSGDFWGPSEHDEKFDTHFDAESSAPFISAEQRSYLDTHPSWDAARPASPPMPRYLRQSLENDFPLPNDPDSRYSSKGGFAPDCKDDPLLRPDTRPDTEISTPDAPIPNPIHNPNPIDAPISSPLISDPNEEADGMLPNRSPKRSIKALARAPLADPFSTPAPPLADPSGPTFEFLKFDGKNDCPHCRQYIHDNRNLRTMIGGLEADQQRLQMIIEELSSRLRQVRRLSTEYMPVQEQDNMDKVFDRLGLLGFLTNDDIPNVYERLYQDALERLRRLQREQLILQEEEAAILVSMSRSRAITPYVDGKSFMTEPPQDATTKTLENWGTKPFKKSKCWRGRSSKESNLTIGAESDYLQDTPTRTQTTTDETPDLPAFTQTTDGVRKLRKKSKESVSERWDWFGEKTNLQFAMTIDVGKAKRPHDIFLGGLVRESKLKRITKPLLLKGH